MNIKNEYEKNVTLEDELKEKKLIRHYKKKLIKEEEAKENEKARENTGGRVGRKPTWVARQGECWVPKSTGVVSLRGLRREERSDARS